MSVKLPQPLEAGENYTIIINNFHFNPSFNDNVVLFGANKNLLLPNWGNGVNITITSTGGVTYPQLLQQSFGQPFDIAQWKIIVQAVTPADVTAQLGQPITAHYFDANRRDATDPIDINKDIFQFQQDAVVFWYPVKIDGNTELRIHVPNLTYVMIKLYPSSIAIPSRLLLEKDEHKRVKVRKINGFMGLAPQGKEFLNGDVLSADGMDKTLLVPKIAGFQSAGEFVN